MGKIPGRVHQGSRHGALFRLDISSTQEPQMTAPINVEAMVASRGKAISMLSTHLVSPPVLETRPQLTLDSPL
jgi:hypothetical protein